VLCEFLESYFTNPAGATNEDSNEARGNVEEIRELEEWTPERETIATGSQVMI
jgi:hypothetical protein